MEKMEQLWNTMTRIHIGAIKKMEQLWKTMNRKNNMHTMEKMYINVSENMVYGIPIKLHVHGKNDEYDGNKTLDFGVHPYEDGIFENGT